jgi:hypothetical protein
MPPSKRSASTPVISEELSQEEKINRIYSLADKIEHIFVTVNKISATLEEQQGRVVKLESEVHTLNKEVSSLKVIVNQHEQASRGSTIRITGFPLSPEERSARNSQALSQRVFDRILQPILSVAQSSGLIDFTPTVSNTIINCFRVGSASARADAQPPPPLVVKLVNPLLRVHILRSKKEARFGPTEEEKARGCKRFTISEDLTQPTFKMLKELQSREEVSRAWTIEGRIHFVRVGTNSVHKVISVFEDVGSILSKVSA